VPTALVCYCLFFYQYIIPKGIFFLSNNGLFVQNGEIVSVNKGDWETLKGFEL